MNVNGYEIMPNANLQWADLRGANLQRAKYGLQSVLAANWRAVSDALTTEMMKWDAHASPNPAAFMMWKNGGDCPLGKTERLFLFAEKRELFRSGKPAMTLWKLWEALCREKEIEI